MECRKCNTDVPAQFEFALAQNICPRCGNKLMPDLAMQVYIDLKKRLREVELVLDKEIVYDRIAMFLVSNYEIKSFDGKIGHARVVPGEKTATHVASVKDFEDAQREALAALGGPVYNLVVYQSWDLQNLGLRT